jgi:hypothetical protein
MEGDENVALAQSSVTVVVAVESAKDHSNTPLPTQPVTSETYSSSICSYKC